MKTRACRTTYCRLSTGLLPILLGVLAVGGLLLGAQPAFAVDTCIQDVWKAHGNKQNLTCTANDVTLSEVTNICVDDGAGGCKPNNACTLGAPVTFTADFRMVLTADTRYDIGFYIATDGGGADGALTGQCAATDVTLVNAPVTFRQIDAGEGNSCGDIEGPEGTAFNPQIVRFSLTTQCSDSDGDGFLNLPFCTTWRQPGSNETCLGIGNGNTTNDVFPGSPSKCNCGTLNVDIFIETATIEVTKTASPLTVLETGGSVTYSVAVKNLAQVATVTLDSLEDDLYGDITTIHDAITATTCVADGDPATCEVGGTIAAGATCTCTFTATVPPGDKGGTVTDTVTACGTDQFGHTDLCDDDTATVTYTDVPEPPSLTKTATVQTCVVDVNYDVVVANTSAQDTLTLNSLSDDKFGNITTVHGASPGPPAIEQVVSTTCGQASGAGTLPAQIAASGNYTCSFVGRINSCSLSHTNQVTGSATDDDGVTYDGNSTPPFRDGATVIISVTTP